MLQHSFCLAQLALFTVAPPVAPFFDFEEGTIKLVVIGYSGGFGYGLRRDWLLLDIIKFIDKSTVLHTRPFCSRDVYTMY
ncbi:hypothetical protein RRF57_009327 [Xylaria bambusicola]|uniref:Secreted protein n=1 Tax=Xylaria bambusicola TaxID=326684 RepID=A0AAN7UPQ3_9PEZI